MAVEDWRKNQGNGVSSRDEGKGAFWAHAGQEAVGKIRYHGADFARFLGVAVSSANRMAVDQETPELKKYRNTLAL